VVYCRDDLEEALMLFAHGDLVDLPVLERPGDPRLIGVLQRKALFDVYNQEVLHKEVLGLKILHRETGMHDCLELPAPYSVRLLTPPKGFLGKTLSELQMRRRYNVTVLAFKRKGFSGSDYNELPDPERRLALVDRLIVVGRDDDLDRLLSETADDEKTT
jgi:uncharacterized protein with PhoU and TrkA domain